MDFNKTVSEILNILVDCILATNDQEQLNRLQRLIDKFNVLIKIEN